MRARNIHKRKSKAAVLSEKHKAEQLKRKEERERLQHCPHHQAQIIARQRRTSIEYYHQNKRAINERVKANPQRLIAIRTRTRIYKVLKIVGAEKSKASSQLVGCAWPFLKQWIEKQFTRGMRWSNYGKWHIDHIVPCASFDLTDPTQPATLLSLFQPSPDVGCGESKEVGEY